MIDLSTAVERLDAALDAEHDLTLKVIEAGHHGDYLEAINSQIGSLYLTEDGWDGDAPFSAFASKPLLPPESVAFQAKARRRLVERVLFKTEKYAAADVGGLVRAFIGENQKARADRPTVALDLATVGGQPRIVAVHEVCSQCNGTGSRDGGPCDFTDYGGATCVDGLKFTGGLSIDSGDLQKSAKQADPKAGWEGLMER